MPNSETNATVFELAVGIEEMQQGFYGWLADIFSHVPEISDFWRDMQTDELRHAEALKKIQGSVGQDRLFSPGDPSVLMKSREILTAPIKDKIRPIMNLNDAYESAHELENSELNMIFEVLVQEFSASNEIRDFALAEVEHHLQKLMDFPKAFGDVDWRKSIAIADSPI